MRGLQVVQVPVAPQVLEGQGMHQAHDMQQRLPELCGALQAGALPAGVKDNCLQATHRVSCMHGPHVRTE